MTLGALLMSGAVVAEAQVTLRLNPDLGAVYELFVSVDTTTEHVLMGEESTTTEEAHALHEVVFEQEETADEFTAEATITAASQDVIGEGSEFMTASPDGGSSPLEALSQAAVGHSFAMTVSSGGVVTSVSGLDEIVDTLFESLDMPEEMKPRLRATLGAQFGDMAMHKRMSQAFVVFPEAPIAVGGSWSVKAAEDGMDATSSMTLESMEDGVATITEMSKLEPYTDPAGGVGAGEFTMGYEDVSGSIVASHRVDLATGMVIDADITQDMTATLRLTVPGMPEEVAAQMPPVPMVVSTVTHIEIQRLD